MKLKRDIGGVPGGDGSGCIADICGAGGGTMECDKSSVVEADFGGIRRYHRWTEVVRARKRQNQSGQGLSECIKI